MTATSHTPKSTEVPISPALAPSLRSQLKDTPKPLWQVPEEATGRTWLVVVTLLTIIGLYAYALAQFYAGAHAGVDQNGYLMTARLIAGVPNGFHPDHPAPIAPEVTNAYAAFDKAKAAKAAATATPTTSAASAPAEPVAPKEIFATDDLLAPNAMQSSTMFDWIRNRLSFIPESPFQFAGRMDVITEPYGPVDPNKPASYRVYAKYPFGYPLLAAIGRWIFGIDGMYIINPLSTVLACYFAYFMFRQLASPFMSMIGVLWLACNPLALFYANDANSHSTTLLCVCVGFWGLLSWMRLGNTWRGFLGGFALGYSCTIRYSEFLLVLPVLFAALQNLRMSNGWKLDKKRLLSSLWTMVGWAIPIVVLALVCWVCFGSPSKTGYTYCREDTGFGWKYLTGDGAEGGMGRMSGTGNWETLVQQLNRTGLFMLWPIALAGLFGMVGSSWRLGVTIALWVLPSTFLYMLYYWAPGGETAVGYLRFFLSMIPGLILAAVWMMERALTKLEGDKRASLALVTLLGVALIVVSAMYAMDEAPIIGLKVIPQVIGALWGFFWTGMGAIITLVVIALVAGIWFWDREVAASKTGAAMGALVITALGCSVNLYTIVPQIEQTHARWVGTRQTVDNMIKLLPKDSLLFADESMSNQLDAIGNWRLFDAALFSGSSFSQSKRKVDVRLGKEQDLQDDPDPIQFERSLFYMKLLGRQGFSGTWMVKSSTELQKFQFDAIDKALAEGRHVAFLVGARDTFGGRMGSPVTLPTRTGYEYKRLGWWVNVQPVREGAGAGGFMGGGRPGRGQFGGGGGAGGGRNNGAAATPSRGGAQYELYEMIKSPPPKPIVEKPVEKLPAKPEVTTPSVGSSSQPATSGPHEETPLEKIRRLRAEAAAARAAAASQPATPTTPPPVTPDPPTGRRENIFGN